MLLFALAWAAASADPPLPAGAIARLGSPRMRAAQYIHRLQFDPTGRVLVAAGAKAIFGWNPATGQNVFDFAYPPNDSIADGRVTTRGDIVMLVRRAGKETHQVERYPFGKREPTSTVPLGPLVYTTVAFAPDGARYAGRDGNAVAVHDTATGKKLWSAALAGSPDAFAFSPDGQRVFAPTGDTVKVFAAADGTLARTLARAGGKGLGVAGAAMSADGQFVALPGGKAGTDFAAFDGDNEAFAGTGTPLGVTPDGKHLVTGTDGGVAYWNTATGKKEREVEVPAARNLSLSPDGRFLAAKMDDAVVLFDAATGKRAPHAADPPGLPKRLWFPRPDELLGELTEYGGWAAWDLATRAGTLHRPAGAADGHAIARTAAGRSFYLQKDALVAFAPAGRFPLGTVLKDDLVASDGTLVAAATDAGVRVVDLNTGAAKLLAGTTGDRPPPTALGVAPGGAVVAVGYAGGHESDKPRLDLYDPAADRLVKQLPLDGAAVKLLFADDGSRVAAVTEQRQPNGERFRGVAVFDRLGGRVAIVPADKTEAKFALSADGRTIAKALGQEVTLIEVATGKVRATVRVGIEAGAAAVDRRTVAVAGPGGPVLLYDAVAGEVPPPEAAWAALAGDNAYAAYRAVAALAADPARGAALLGEKMKPVPPPDAARLAILIADLDAPAFGVRDKATRELKALGDLAAPAVEAALAAATSAEVRQRAEAILATGAKPTGDIARAVRAIEALEWMGTPAAAAVLDALAAGAAGARQTRAAAAARRRMK